MARALAQTAAELLLRDAACAAAVRALAPLPVPHPRRVDMPPEEREAAEELSAALADGLRQVGA